MTKKVIVTDAFEKHFPKVCERPGLQPYKEEIRAIVMNIVKDIVTLPEHINPFHKLCKEHESGLMPYHKEL